jgi:4,5-DOPA dioxygenase extradiol
MYAIFIGHGSPFNAILRTPYSEFLQSLGKSLPTPKAILSISAHWLTRGTYITSSPFPEQIYDFSGFPNELYRVKYRPPGSSDLAQMIASQFPEEKMQLTDNWGLDHGTWAVLVHLFPKANIPVLQLSIDIQKNFQEHLILGEKLSRLTEQGILILGSGNIVHNLREADFFHINSQPDKKNIAFDTKIGEYLRKEDTESLLNFSSLGAIARYAVPTTEHFIPVFYIYGSRMQGKYEVLYEEYQNSSISMRSFGYKKEETT